MTRPTLTTKAKKTLRGTRTKVMKEVGVSSKAFQLLMNTLTLPHETPPVRYPIAGFSKRTAAKKLYAEFNYLAQASSNDYWPVILARSPVHPVWTVGPVGSGELIHEWVLQVVQDGNIPSFVSTQMKFGSAYAMPGVGPASFCPSAAYPYLIYVPYGAEIQLNVGNGNTAGHEVKVHLAGLTTLSGGKPAYMIDAVIPISNGGGTHTVVANQGAWFKLDRFSTADANGLVVTTTFSTEFVIHVKAPDVGANIFTALLPAFPPIAQKATVTLMGETRITASSLLMTNTTTVLMKGGRMDAAYLDYEQNNVFNSPSLPEDILSRHSDLRYFGPGDKGLYMFTTPCEKAQALTSYLCPDNIEVDTSGPSVPPGILLCALEDFQLPTAGLYQEVLVSTGASVGQQFSCFYDQHLEAVTGEQVWDVATAEPWLTPDIYQKMLVALSNLRPGCENPGHWDKLKNFVKSAFVFAKPEIASIAGRLAGMLL